jgi:hypothetical protein
MRQLYILDENKRPKLATRIEWHLWMDNVENRRVAQHELHAPLFDEDVLVSTYFTGVPCGSGMGMHFFETVVIGSKFVHDDFSQSYRTWGVAAIAHDRVVRELKLAWRYSPGDHDSD